MKRTPLHIAIQQIVHRTVEQALCSGEIVDFFALKECIGSDRLVIPTRPVCTGYVRSLADNITKHGRVHVPILLEKVPDGNYLVVDGVYRLQALKKISQKIFVKAKLMRENP